MRKGTLALRESDFYDQQERRGIEKVLDFFKEKNRARANQCPCLGAAESGKENLEPESPQELERNQPWKRVQKKKEKQ